MQNLQSYHLLVQRENRSKIVQNFQMTELLVFLMNISLTILYSLTNGSLLLLLLLLLLLPLSNVQMIECVLGQLKQKQKNYIQNLIIGGFNCSRCTQTNRIAFYI